jgi:hypothetical protein
VEDRASSPCGGGRLAAIVDAVGQESDRIEEEVVHSKTSSEHGSRVRAGSAEQARSNRDYVRRLLREKQPEFAAALESVERSWS